MGFWLSKPCRNVRSPRGRPLSRSGRNRRSDPRRKIYDVTAMPEGGLVVIAVTPFADDGTVDEAGVGQLIDFYLSCRGPHRRRGL